MIHDSVLVLLQNLIPLDAIGDPLPVPPGITGKATPAIFYQQRSFTPFTKTIVRVANLHGTAAIFPADCLLLPVGTAVPPSITIPNTFDPEVYVLTALGLDFLRSLPGTHFNPLWLNTSGSTPPHPIQFISEFPSLPAAVVAPAVNNAGLVNLANSNPLYPINSSVHNKSNALQKTLFENLAFWFWWNGQDLQSTLNIFGGAGNEDILCSSAVDHIMSKLHKRFLLYPICRPENIKLLMRGFFSKLLTCASNGSFNSISICLFTNPNADGTPYIFKNPTDPLLAQAVNDFFEIICSLFTPNTTNEQRRSSELLARVASYMNDHSYVGNLSSSHMGVRVELINTVLFNLFQIPKLEPFRSQKTVDPTLNPEFWNKVTDVLVYSTEEIQKINLQALNYPKETSKQFGFLDPATSPSKKQKQKQPKTSPNKKPKVVATVPTVPSPTKPLTTSGSGTISNSVHCVNHAASLMTSQ